MKEYPLIRDKLGAVFSVETGLARDAALAMLRRSVLYSSPDWRERFERELIAAFSSPETRWAELLFNEEYEVYELESDEEARNVAIGLLWEPTFPGKSPPTVATGDGNRESGTTGT